MLKQLSCLIALFLFPAAALTQAYIPVSGSQIKDNKVALLTGQVRFTVTDINNQPVTYTPQGGSPTTATIGVNVKNGLVQNNAGFPPTIPNPDTMSPANSRYRMEIMRGTDVLLTFPLIQITGQANFSVDGFRVSLTQDASGTTVNSTGHGMPKWPCNPGATFDDLDDTAPYPWVCSQLASDNSIVWTQNPSVVPLCAKGNSQAIASPINGSGPPYCLPATSAWATPGYVYAGPPGNSAKPGQVGMVPVSQLCAGGACGTGSPPGGAIYEIQSNQNGTQFGGSGFYTNTDHSYLFTLASQWGQFSRNSQKSNYCIGAQCSNVSVFGQDTPLLNGLNNPIGFGKLASIYRTNLYTALGTFDGFSGDPNQPGGGDYYGADVRKNVFHTPSIGQSISMNTFCGKPYDCAGLYSYIWYHGGLWGGSDEAGDNIRANGGNYANRLAQFTVLGSPGTGATTVTTSGIGNADDLFVGGFVYDAYASPIATGNITAYNTATHMLTATAGSFTPATNIGTTTGVISVPVPDAVNGTSVTVTVHVTTGSGFTISATNPVYFACANPELESTVPTAVGAVDGSGNQTITANFFHGHAAGCTVSQGGTVGILDLTADQQPSFWKTSYFVFAAPDNSHIMEVTYLSGVRGFINNFRHNFGGGQNTVFAQITGNGTTITACGLGQSAANFAGQYVQISGATPSTFNGIYTASALNQNLCVTMAGTATGTATGATFAVGGAINSPDGTIKGPGGFNVWTTARIRQIGTSPSTVNSVTTNAYNNVLYFYPNNMTWVNGHGYGVLDDMQGSLAMISARGNTDTPPSGLGVRWLASESAGTGISGINYRQISAVNGNSYTWYKNGGGTGQLDGATGLSIEGPWLRDIYMNVPLQGGASIYIEKGPTAGNPNQPNSFFPLFVAGPAGGSGGFTINYDPNNGKTIITSGTGNGVYTGITMTPSDISLVAASTGLFTMQGQTYKFTGLAGASTACLSADTTGTLGRSCPVFGASGSSHSTGLVPDPGATAGTTKFLREDGTWQVPPGGGGTGTVTSFSATAPPSLFTTAVATATTTPALSFTLANANGHNFFGNCSETAGAPNYCQPSFGDISGTAAAAQLPLATTGSFGAVKPDGTTITVSGGVISSVGGILGLTTGKIPVATSSTSIGDSPLDTTTNAGAVTSSVPIYAPAYYITGTSGAGLGAVGNEGTALTVTAGQGGWWFDSTTHRPMFNANAAGVRYYVGLTTTGTAGNVPVFDANGVDLVDSGTAGITSSGSSCTITEIKYGIVTGATCTP